MLTRWLAPALLLAGCATTPSPSKLPLIQTFSGQPVTIRMLLDTEESMRLSRAGITDPASPSGLTDRFRYRAAVDDYVAYVLKAYGLCPQGFGTVDVAPAQKPFETAITVACLSPA